MHNSYPELPVIPYRKTSTTDAVDILANFMFPVEVKKAAYVIAYNESGGFKSGINNNYAGFQSDAGRWKPEGLFAFTATCVVTDSTGIERGFLAFDTPGDCLYMLCFKVQDKGLYIGGDSIDDAKDLGIAYWREWVEGDELATMPRSELKEFKRLYEKAGGVR